MRWCWVFLMGCAAGLASQARADALMLDHPVVLDSATVRSGDLTIGLAGIDGLSGRYAQSLEDYLARAGDRLTCAKQDDGEFVCRLPDGADLAQVVLLNGAARARHDAPAAYHAQEAAAQVGRRGVWAGMPAPPEVLTHPQLQDTATVWADGTRYGLKGLVGFGAPYAAEMQDYILAHGDSLTCAELANGGRFVCLLPDGTDLAEVALRRGAARVGLGAPDAYRRWQAEAATAGRGLWQAGGDAAGLPARPRDPMSAAGDDAPGGIVYPGGMPAAVIGGSVAFLVYGDGLGWGYYDRTRLWHEAPEPFRSHLERFHPDGEGLPGQASRIRRREAAMRYDGLVRTHEAVAGRSAEAGAVARAGLVPVAVHRPVRVTAPREVTPDRVPRSAVADGHGRPVAAVRPARPVGGRGGVRR